MMNRQGFDDRWLGRRVNDEVELFLDEGDEEVSRSGDVYERDYTDLGRSTDC